MDLNFRFSIFNPARYSQVHPSNFIIFYQLRFYLFWQQRERSSIELEIRKEFNLFLVNGGVKVLVPHLTNGMEEISHEPGRLFLHFIFGAEVVQLDKIYLRRQKFLVDYYSCYLRAMHQEQKGELRVRKDATGNVGLQLVEVIPEQRDATVLKFLRYGSLFLLNIIF